MTQKIHSSISSCLIQADSNQVWRKLGFYEQVQKQPSLLLRLCLPVPVEVEGRHRAIGDVCRCKYSDGGYLSKRITGIDEGRCIEFEIIEQSIRYQHLVKLLGGRIELLPQTDQRLQLKMVTYYENRIAPAFLSRLGIDTVIRSMHRFVMQDMIARLEAAAAPAVAQGAG